MEIKNYLSFFTDAEKSVCSNQTEYCITQYVIGLWNTFPKENIKGKPRSDFMEESTAGS